MRNMRILVMVTWSLWGILIVGALLFVADSIIQRQNANASISQLSILTGWRDFGSAVFALIIIAVSLGLVLAFKAATVIPVTNKVPEVYEVENTEPNQSNQPDVSINAPNNRGLIIGKHQGQVNIETQQQPRLSLSKWEVTQLSDRTYQSKARVTSDIPYTFPRLTFIAKAKTIMSFMVTPDSGVSFSKATGTVEGGMFDSSANLLMPCNLTVATREKEDIELNLTTWNPLSS